MPIESSPTKYAGSFSNRQRLFMKYTFFVLIDLTVLNLFNQYWEHVFIEFFSISLLAAMLLQALLQVTIAIEHRVASFFKNRPGLRPKIVRILATWAILFGSKLAILKVIALSFGNSVQFGGPIHGLVAFIIVVIAIIVSEQAFLKVYRALA